MYVCIYIYIKIYQLQSNRPMSTAQQCWFHIMKGLVFEDLVTFFDKVHQPLVWLYFYHVVSCSIAKNITRQIRIFQVTTNLVDSIRHEVMKVRMQAIWQGRGSERVDTAQDLSSAFILFANFGFRHPHFCPSIC